MQHLDLLLLEDNPEESCVLQHMLHTHNYKVSIVQTIESAREQVEMQTYDILILDIMLQGKPDGISFAKELHKSQIEIPFVFLTSMQSKTIFEEAKYTHPFSYLLKPCNELELLYALDLALETHYKQTHTISIANSNAVLGPEYLFIKKNDRLEKLNVTNIYYISVEEKYCCFVSSNGNYLVKKSLKQLKDQLANQNFVQVHRNYLVNIKAIKEIYQQDNLIVVENGDKIPFSDRSQASFLKNNAVFK